MKTHSYNWRYAAMATIACMIGGVALVLVIGDLVSNPMFGGKSLIRNALFRHTPDKCGENPGRPTSVVIPWSKLQPYVREEAEKRWEKWSECEQDAKAKK